MELSDPSESIYGQMAGMEPRRLSVTPASGGSSGGNGGRSVGSTSSRRRRRMSDGPSGTRLMPQFNAAAAADGGGFRSLSPEAVELQFDGWRLFLSSPMRSPVADDNVLIMDGVVVGNSGSRIASSTMRSVTFSGPDLVAAGSPGSRGGNSCGFNGQVTGSSSSGGGNGYDSSTLLQFGLLGSSDGSGYDSSTLQFGLPGSSDGGRYGSSDQFAWREDPDMMQGMRPRFSEVASPNSRRPSIGYPNMQGSPITPYLFPPSLPGPAFPTAVSSYHDAAITIRPPAPYFTPPRVTVSAARPSPPTPQQPEAEPVQTPSFSWPPTAEEDAYITQKLYGPSASARRRLPVFQAICPALPPPLVT